MGNRYIYSQNMFMNDPYAIVEINHKNLLGRLFCKHSFCELVREDKTQLFLNPNGDEIEIICPKCGASKGIMFWQYEGNGYK